MTRALRARLTLTVAAIGTLAAVLFPAPGALADGPHPGPPLAPRYGRFAAAEGELAWARRAESANAQRSLSPATVATTPAGANPFADALDQATDTIYVANFGNPDGGNTVSVINGRTCQAADLSQCSHGSPTVTVGSDPSDLAVDQASDTVYVTSFSGNTVSVIDGATCNGQVRSGCSQKPPTVAVGGNSTAVAVDPANHTAYVTNAADNDVSMINTATCNASDLTGCQDQKPPTVAVGVGPAWVAVNQMTHTVYVANDDAASPTNDGTSVSVFDASTCNATVQIGCSRTGLITVGTGPIAIAVDEGTNTIYTANIGSNTVSVIDGRTCDASDLAGCATQAPGTVAVGQSPVAAGLDSSAHTLYVANSDDDTVSVIDTGLCNGRDRPACSSLVAPTVQAGAEPVGTAVDPATGTLYVPNGIDNDVSVIDMTQCDAANTAGCRTPTTTIPLGNAPGTADVDVATHTVYVANQLTGQVMVIDGAACNADHPDGCHHIAATVTVGTPGANGSDAITVAVNQATDTVYAVNAGEGENSTVKVINGASCNATHTAGCRQAPATIDVGVFPIGIAVDQASDTVYVANTGSNTISVIDGATCDGTDHSGCGRTPATLAVTGTGFGLAVDQATNTLYAVAANDTLSVINGATCDAANSSGCGQTPATVTVGSDPTGVAVDQAANTVYVANNANGDAPATVSVINGATCDGTIHSGCSQTAATAPAGRGAFGLAVDQAANKIIVASFNDASVSLINAATCNGTNTAGCGSVPAKEAAGSGAFWVAVDTATGTAYVSDFNDNDLAVVSVGR
jgi:YVTN family beta-propeller protein